MANQEKGEEGEDEVITAVYKLNFHCLQCAREVKKPLKRTPGVYGVEIDTESGEIKVKGKIDPQKIQELIEKRSKKKVELVSAPPKIKKKVEEKKVEEKKENKEKIYRETTMKVHMHCGNCEFDLKNNLLKLEGVYNVHTDIKAETVKVDGTIDPQKIIKFLHRNLHKHAEIIHEKKEVKEQKNEKKKEIDDKFIESTKEVKEQKKEKVNDKFIEATKEVKEQKIEKEKEVKFDESTWSTYGGEKKVVVEVRVREENVVPYVIHYVHAPQMFSDENPNACTIM
ncbi:hypothetical protein NE237_024578 [Protea cynaroides]|uniref:HMA domain-containing protein n=1 Tax=Protea cynaroides TaxID=273540 RepID=A0A9Q0JZR2_9MAGN|nr:hypothetical protein NE237_024578 [Protea cynaroides]